MVVLCVGSKGPEVGNWQRFLNAYRAQNGGGLAALDVDEDFGNQSRDATLTYQSSKGFPTTGMVDSSTRNAALSDGFVPFIQAKNYTPLWPAKRDRVDLVVVHTMESPEGAKTAVNVATWFAGANAPQASAHFCVDAVDVIQCVRETDVAWHAPNANRTGIGVEHAGYARQTAAEWADDYSKNMLEKSAQLVAQICKRWNIPIMRLRAADLRLSGARGITGHVDVTDGLNGGKGHVDPGPNFPFDAYLARIKELV